MQLNDKQRALLESEAKRRGVDPAALIREAEKISASRSVRSENTEDAPDKEQPKLFMYLLPFVRVREVRKIWLGLDESFPGDDEIASAWAAKQGGGNGSPPAAE